ncbi:MAG: glycosyltransferase family 4 protein, partial [Pseudomonadota bacterium]
MLDAADQAPKPQRLIIYHPWVYLKSGLERTLLEIARRSRHEVVIHTSHFDPQGTYPELSDYSVKEHTRVSVRRTYWEVIKAARAILGLRFDPKTYDVLVISCDGLGPLLMFRNKGKPALNLVFTPLRAVYDEVYRAKMLEGGGFKASLRLVAERVFKLLDRRAWRHFDGVISISKTVTHRIVRDGLYEEDRIVLSYAGIDAERIGPGKPPEKYFFLPGRIMWTKNISLAIEAFGHLRNAHPDWRLVIGGMVDAKSEAHFAELKAAADNIGNIEFRRDLTEAEMLDLYDRCSCVVMTA